MTGLRNYVFGCLIPLILISRNLAVITNRNETNFVTTDVLEIIVPSKINNRISSSTDNHNNNSDTTTTTNNNNIFVGNRVNLENLLQTIVVAGNENDRYQYDLFKAEQTDGLTTSTITNNNNNNNNDEDDKKTLSEQVADGKYGLIQKELFAVETRKPGIISYDINPEVPKDNINSLGGLKPDDIWLAENHLLVLAGDKVRGDASPWIPIDNYIAPARQVKLPELPKIPPPFPVQLVDNGPVEYLKGENGSTGPPPIIPFFLMFPPPPHPTSFSPPSSIAAKKLSPYQPITITNDEPLTIPRPSINYTTPTYFGPPLPSFVRPLYPPTSSNNLSSIIPKFLPPSPSLYKPLPGAEFIPPFGNITDSFDEDDPSLYYPAPYDFYYPVDNSTDVPPGPLVPGIVLPPPPNFFSLQSKSRRPSSNGVPSYKKPTKLGARYRSKFFGKIPYGVNKQPLNEVKYSPIEFTTPIKEAPYTILDEKKMIYDDKRNRDEWIPIPAPQPYYITGVRKKKPFKHLNNNNDYKKHELTNVYDRYVYYYSNNDDNNYNNYDNDKNRYTTSKPGYTVTSAKMYHPPIESQPNDDKSVQKIYYFYEEPKQPVAKNYFHSAYPTELKQDTTTSTPPTAFIVKPTTSLPIIGGGGTTPLPFIQSVDTTPIAEKDNQHIGRRPKTGIVSGGAPIIPIYYLAELDNYYERQQQTPQNSAVVKNDYYDYYTSKIRHNDNLPTPRPIFEYSYTATGYREDNNIKQPAPYVNDQTYWKNKPPSPKQTFYETTDYRISPHPNHNQYYYQQQQPYPVNNRPDTVYNLPPYVYNIRLSPASSIPQRNEHSEYYKFNNQQSYHKSPITKPYYIQPWNADGDNNNNNNNNNNVNNKWINSAHHGGKTLYQTENPFYAFFTKDDEQFIDENTKKYFTLFGQKIRKFEHTTGTIPITASTVPSYPDEKTYNRQFAVHPVNSLYSNNNHHHNEWGTTPLPSTQVDIDGPINESTVVSLEGDTLVNYINPPVTYEPEAELIDGNLVKYTTPSNEPYKQTSYKSSTSVESDNDRYPLVEDSSSSFTSSSSEEEELDHTQTITTLKPASLARDTDVNYKRKKPFLNPDAEYITTVGPDTKQVDNISNGGVSSSNKLIRIQARPHRQKVISLERDIAVNYRSPRPPINPDAEFVYPHSSWKQHQQAESRQPDDRRLPNSQHGGQYHFLQTPRQQIYKFQEDLSQPARKYQRIEAENYDFQTDAEKSSNYLKRTAKSSQRRNITNDDTRENSS